MKTAKATKRSPQFVVTTLVGKPEFSHIAQKRRASDHDILRSEIWDSSSPLPIGFPFRWILENTGKMIRVRSLVRPINQASSDASVEYPIGDLEAGLPLKLDSNARITLKIQPVSAISDELGWTPRLVTAETASETELEKYFRKILLRILAAFLVLGVIVAVWPKKKEDPEELIPAQYAKILLSATPKGESAGSQAPAPSANKESNMVQAFRSQALQKSASSLVKGGALALLQRSDLLGGAKSKAAVAGIFDAKSKLSTSESLQAGDAKSVEVGKVGGKGTSAYGNGKGVTLDGQGSSFVSLDTGGASVEEGLSQDEIGQVIHSHLAEIRYCYDSAMIRDPNVEGKIQVAFTIRLNGSVKTASVKNTNVADPGLAQCVVSRLLTWQFPKPKGGIEVGVSYPFIFKKLAK